MTFHVMFVQVIFCSVWVAECQLFGKELLTRLIIWFLCVLTICICNFSFSRFDFGAGFGF